MTTYLIYIDDSGAEATDLIVFDWITVGSSYARKRKGHRYHEEKVRAYGALVGAIETWLQDSDSIAVVIMDGDGSDKALARAHRTLPRRTRRVLEDPLFLGSATSQWVQVADLIAYAAYQAVLRDPHRAFAWSWYPTLSSVDVLGGPQPVLEQEAGPVVRHAPGGSAPRS